MRILLSCGLSCSWCGSSRSLEREDLLFAHNIHRRFMRIAHPGFLCSCCVCGERGMGVGLSALRAKNCCCCLKYPGTERGRK